jgi:mRNA interferase RelE/StbE
MEIVYSLAYHALVVREDIPALDAVWRQRIKRAIEEKLTSSPDLFGLPLRRSLKGYRKLRVGDYRIVFRIEKKTVLIMAMLHRSTIYHVVGRRT